MRWNINYNTVWCTNTLPLKMAATTKKYKNVDAKKVVPFEIKRIKKNGEINNIFCKAKRKLPGFFLELQTELWLKVYDLAQKKYTKEKCNKLNLYTYINIFTSLIARWMERNVSVISQYSSWI